MSQSSGISFSERRLMLPREHGAWGIVLLPFLAGALVVGTGPLWRVILAAAAVFSLFLLREPLLFYARRRLATGKHSSSPSVSHSRLLRDGDVRRANTSLTVYGVLAMFTAILLWRSLPPLPLVLLGAGAATLFLLTLRLFLRNQQRKILFQLVTVVGLTSSSLMAYLAALGRLDNRAFWLWALCAAHYVSAVLVVRARLERMAVKGVAPQGPRPRAIWNSAAAMQIVLAVFLIFLAVSGRPWWLLPFLPPAVVHAWELRSLINPVIKPALSMQQTGLLQLGSSVLFSLLLIVVLR